MKVKTGIKAGCVGNYSDDWDDKLKAEFTSK